MLQDSLAVSEEAGPDMTETMLIVGGVSAMVFLAVLLIEGALRSGYDPTYHTGSELSLGDRGWIQIANFVQMGVGMLAFAAGVYRILNTAAGALLLAIFGLGMITSGVFVTEPIRGYPPGAATGTSEEPSWQHKIHEVSGPVAFLAIFGACLTLAGRLDGFWRLYTLFTAVVGLGLTMGTALAYQREAAKLGLIQRGLILVYWSWIVLLGMHLT